MYGLIHNALHQMVTEKFGREQWQKVMELTGTPDDAFTSTRSYDDVVTLSLVAAVSDVLELPVDDCLDQFGQYWLAEFAPQSYDMLLSAAGGSLFEFLENLNALHDRISTTFVGYGPPTFKLRRLSDNHAKVLYRSGRSGLVPFVLGLIKGMQVRFNVVITIGEVIIDSTGEGDSATIDILVAPQEALKAAPLEEQK
ncbi:MAG: hypothetical protein ACI82A_004035 [Candidatus Azotimanducaceae bacterium]|jgi:hypothetical protein